MTKRWIFFSLVGLSTALFLFGSWRYGSVLVRPDEPLYTQISLEMLDQHSVLVPLLHHQPSFVKPPFVYWLELVAFWLFGKVLWGARLPIWLLGIASVVFTFRIGEKLISRDVGFRGAALLASSVVFFQYSQADMMDVPLTFFVLLSLYTFILAERESRRWLWLSGLVIGVATLVKGPIGALLAVILIILYCFQYSSWKLWMSMDTVIAVLLYVFAACAWPAFLGLHGFGKAWMNEFVIGENLGKFGGPVMPVKILLIGLFGGIAPWTFLLIESFARFIKSNVRTKANVFLLGWIVSLLLVFILPARKLPHYAMPLFPAACLLVASMDEFSIISLWLTRIVIGIVGLAWIAEIRLTEFRWVQVILMFGGLSAFWAAYRLRGVKTLAVSSVCFFLLLSTVPVVMPAIELREQNAIVRELSRHGVTGVFCPNDREPRGFELSPRFMSCESVGEARELLSHGGELVFSEYTKSLLQPIPLITEREWVVWRSGIGLGQVMHAVATADSSQLLEKMYVARLAR